MAGALQPCSSSCSSSSSSRDLHQRGRWRTAHLHPGSGLRPPVVLRAGAPGRDPSQFVPPNTFAFTSDTAALPRLVRTHQPGLDSASQPHTPAPQQPDSSIPPAPLYNGTPSTPKVANGQSNPSRPTHLVTQASVSTPVRPPAADASTQTPSPSEERRSSRERSPDAADSVAEALARAQDAISRAESSLEGIEELPSARPPSQWSTLFKLVRTVVVVSALSFALVSSQALGLGVQWLAAVLAATGIGWWGYSRGSLDKTGAVAALVVGAATIGCSLRFGVTLLAFFFSSSKLTQFKEDFKNKLDDSNKAGGQRDWKQVLCNGGVPMALAVAYGILVGCVDVPLGPSLHVEAWRAKLATMLGGAFLGYYACCCGDTWASELGPLSSDTPRLITTLRPVRRGTNGGVTLLGLSASILGGMFIGAVFYAVAIISPTLWILDGLQAAAVQQWRLIPLGLMAGLFGSVLDSLLGATLQYTGYNRSTGRVTSKPGPDVTHISGMTFLDNNMVNLVSATVTAALTAVAACFMFGV